MAESLYSQSSILLNDLSIDLHMTCFKVHEKVIANITLLLHNICGYQCDKAMDKNDTVKWYDIISLSEMISYDST